MSPSSTSSTRALQSAGPLAGGPGCPRAATRVFKFEPGRQRVLRSTIRGPPARAARLSDRPTVCLPRAACLPARAPRALGLSEWEAGVSIRASKKETLVLLQTPFGTSLYTHALGNHHIHTVTNNRKNQRIMMWGWSCRHRFTHHHTPTISEIITQRIKAQGLLHTSPLCWELYISRLN